MRLAFKKVFSHHRVKLNKISFDEFEKQLSDFSTMCLFIPNADQGSVMDMIYDINSDIIEYKITLKKEEMKYGLSWKKYEDLSENMIYGIITKMSRLRVLIDCIQERFNFQHPIQQPFTKHERPPRPKCSKNSNHYSFHGGDTDEENDFDFSSHPPPPSLIPRALDLTSILHHSPDNEDDEDEYVDVFEEMKKYPECCPLPSPDEKELSWFKFDEVSEAVNSAVANDSFFFVDYKYIEY